MRTRTSSFSLNRFILIWVILYDIKNMLRTFLEDGFTFEFPFVTVSDSLELELELVLDSPVLLALTLLA